MEKIIVTTDFSSNSKVGIRFGLQLQRQANYELTFYHAVAVMKPTSWNDKQYKSFATKTIAENTKKLKAFVASIAKKSGHSTDSYQYYVEIGTEVSDLVHKHAKKIKAAFICMASTGAGTFGRLFGTHTSSLIFTSTIPLLVVPKTYRSKNVSSLLYASDFSSLEKELKTVHAFADKVDAQIEVYHYDYLLHVPENKAKLYQKAKKFEAPNVTFNFIKKEVDDSLAECLERDIYKIKPSLLILFTKKNRSWFDRLFPSGTSANVALDAQIPMMIFQKNK